MAYEDSSSSVTVNQRVKGGQWHLLGTYGFAPGAGHQVTLTASSDGAVVADAIKLVGTGPAPADLVYLHTDAIGLPQKFTDATQAVVWDRVQDPFGRQVSLTSSGGIDTSLRFPGQQADPDTGFAYNYLRDYDPTLGRYLQADPIGLAGGINRYAYVGGNPVTHVDPEGTQAAIPMPAPPVAVPGSGGDVTQYGTPANKAAASWLWRQIQDAWDRCVSAMSREHPKQCQRQYESDSKICRILPTPYLRQECWASASERQAYCIRTGGEVGWPPLQAH